MASTPRRALDTPATTGQNNAFLLAQLGAHATRRFAALVAELELNPPQVGLLRAVAKTPGASQQTLAQQLGTPPTRMVALVDGLEQRGLLQRKRNADDRRLYAVGLTQSGRKLLSEIGCIVEQHNSRLLNALDPSERDQLHDLLSRVAAEQNLKPGVHPGYRTLSATRPAADTRCDQDRR